VVSARVSEQAEWVPVRVEHHAHVRLRLMLREGHSRRLRPCHTFSEIDDTKVEVHHHPLPTLVCGPRRSHVARLPLDFDLLQSVGRTQHRPSVVLGRPSLGSFAPSDRSTKELLVERREFERAG
jgi:hypothetical protein